MERVVIENKFRIIERSEDEDEQIVTGIVADPENVDSYGQMIEAAVVRKMAHNYMQHHRNLGTDHAKDEDGNPIILNEDIVILESWVTREEGVIGGETVPVGAWVLVVRVLNDEIWQRVLDGELNGYSFEAIVWRVPIEEVDESLDEAMDRMVELEGKTLDIVRQTERFVDFMAA
jgi:hypothetical protein